MNRQALTVLAAYGVFALLLLGVLALRSSTARPVGSDGLSALPAAVSERVQFLCPRLVRNGVTLATASDCAFHTRNGTKSFWAASGDTSDQHVSLCFDQAQGTLVQFSQSAPAEWTWDRAQWTVNDARTAETVARRYLRLLKWERPGNHWELEKETALSGSIWLCVYQSGTHHLALRLHRWNGTLLLFELDH